MRVRKNVAAISFFLGEGDDGKHPPSRDFPIASYRYARIDGWIDGGCGPSAGPRARHPAAPSQVGRLPADGPAR